MFRPRALQLFLRTRHHSQSTVSSLLWLFNNHICMIGFFCLSSLIAKKDQEGASSIAMKSLRFRPFGSRCIRAIKFCNNCIC
ncbi:hypothetical protein LIER_00717 [Lithospermum erythrorhizon]|uniref:Uncharacterized protein n=1 Tax=Lithospermum erythrorhizon TaxID=34254 RepID=A0AAV3NIB2_LITER